MNYSIEKYKGALGIFCKQSNCFILFGKREVLEKRLLELNEPINTFEDWLYYMNDYDYSLEELLDFKDHYQNLLSFEQNTINFIKFIAL